jgi:nitroimidazol reductase NimA-like FMN-containing flavoprotein (pyridoxamine 5'-phosphate oxidase superfamily)
MSWSPAPDDEVKNVVRELLATKKTLFLSTSTRDQPFVAPVYFAESDPFHLTLITERGGRSLANLAHNPNVALILSTGSPFDLYVQGAGHAEVLSDRQQLGAAMDAVRAKAPEIELLKLSPAAVRVTIRHWQATDATVGWRPKEDFLPPVEQSPN